MGNDNETSRGVIGRNILPDLNLSDVLLLDFCVNHRLSIMNTMFQQNDVQVAPSHSRLEVDDRFCNGIIVSAAVYSGHLGEERSGAFNSPGGELDVVSPASST